MPECLQDGKLGRKKKKKTTKAKKKSTRGVDAKGNLNSVRIIVTSKLEKGKHGYISTCFEDHNHEDDVLMKQNNERHNSEAQEVGENVKLQS